ncbi:MAG: hypothetical protein ACHQ0J_11085 [Candidatus Dormibacterales bacterium]
MVEADMADHGSEVIAAPGWAAVYVREGGEFVWPLVAWLRPAPGPGPLVVGLALSFDGRTVVRADQIEGFKCYLPPAEWLADPPDRPVPAPGRP